MPTGYTAALYDGPEEFGSFVLKCAHAFLIEMRDEPIGAPLPDSFEPSSFYEEGLAKANKRIDELKSMSSADIALKAMYHAGRVNAENALLHDQLLERHRRFVEMDASVRAWSPPTPDHEGLKRFMLEQLSHNIEAPPKMKPVSENAEDWFDREMKSALWELDYYTQNVAEQREIAASRTAWVKALKSSVLP